MSCCGKQRESMRGTASAGASRGPRQFTPQARNFEYTANGELQVLGALTGTLYTFRGRGAQLSIHSSDVASLVSVPSLRMLA